MPDDPRPAESKTGSDTNKPGTWYVWRRDEQGNSRVIDSGLSEEAARQLVAIYKSQGRNEVHWASPMDEDR